MTLLRLLLPALLLIFNAAGGGTDPLNDSTRHQEWVTIRSQDRALKGFLVTPEVDHPVAAVILIHGNRGLTDWLRTVADRLAAEGYLALAPDLLSGRASDGGGTSDFQSTDAARNAIYDLDSEGVTADLNAAADFLARQPVANGVVMVTGFSWGGSQSFRFATKRPELAAAFVFYGRAPGDDFESIECPVYGFYGGDDTRINATIPLTGEIMLALDKVFEPLTYHQAGHSFMRKGEHPDASDGNRIAMNASWDRWLAILAEHAEPEDLENLSGARRP
ncbi:MAG: dienelactone hydrolase family protein [Verrucomicrobia bacterium]|nr:MAG: dienelactone hydrolase family protein [Verrucomicrobiota bacterium]